jgi:hypothetical protein
VTEFNFKWKDKTYPLDWNTLSGKEAIELDKLTGLKPAQLLMDFSNGGARGCLGFLWVALKRGGVDVDWDDLTEEPIFQLDGSLGVTPGDTVDPTTASTPRSRAGRAGGKGSSARSRKN